MEDRNTLDAERAIVAARAAEGRKRLISAGQSKRLGGMRGRRLSVLARVRRKPVRVVTTAGTAIRRRRDKNGLRFCAVVRIPWRQAAGRAVMPTAAFRVIADRQPFFGILAAELRLAEFQSRVLLG